MTLTLAALLILYAFLVTVIIRAFMWLNRLEPKWEIGTCDGFLARKNLNTGSVHRPVKKGDNTVWRPMPYYMWKSFKRRE